DESKPDADRRHDQRRGNPEARANAELKYTGVLRRRARRLARRRCEVLNEVLAVKRKETVGGHDDVAETSHAVAADVPVLVLQAKPDAAIPVLEASRRIDRPDRASADPQVIPRHEPIGEPARRGRCVLRARTPTERREGNQPNRETTYR